MNILNAMDSLLDGLAEDGFPPRHWIIRQSDWLAIGMRFKKGLLPNPELVGHNTYRGIPVHLGELNENELAAIVCGVGDNVTRTAL
jgi:hypothetical protein